MENLRDISRLQTGALSLHEQFLALDEIIPIALDGLRPEADPVRWNPAPKLPALLADPVF